MIIISALRLCYYEFLRKSGHNLLLILRNILLKRILSCSINLIWDWEIV